MAQRNAITVLLLHKGYLPCIMIPQDNCLGRTFHCSYLLNKRNVFCDTYIDIQAELIGCGMSPAPSLPKMYTVAILALLS